MAVDLARDLVPDGLWKIAAPLIPRFRPRQQGGRTVPVADRKVFTAVVYVLTSGCTAWTVDGGTASRARFAAGRGRGGDRAQPGVPGEVSG
ncbi:transposase [Streptomyces rhizosphaerihabitans]|uniref:transposase n=1 Tax=Streptomyces rhizosphaerihabitans TaxID=1266770 RepID=UPI0037044A2C